MTKEEALRRVKGYLTDYIPADNYEEVEEIVGALEQEPCEDCISRQVVLDALESIGSLDTEADRKYARSVFEALSPVTTQPKTGHWIDGKCNRCGTHAPYWAMASTYYCSKYCPNCGTKMEVEE